MFDTANGAGVNLAGEYGYPYAIFNEACASLNLNGTFVYNGGLSTLPVNGITNGQKPVVTCPAGITGLCYKSNTILNYNNIPDTRTIAPNTEIADSTCSTSNLNPHFCLNGTTAGSLAQEMCPVAVTPPTYVWTDINLSPKNAFTIGERVYGYISGGDPNNTWTCAKSPLSNANTCEDPSEWRRLGSDYDGHADDWQVNPAAGRLELRSGMFLDPNYPQFFVNGTYT